jgi:outer membrane protein OmpA-like peptidoglycan-associated protein
MTATTFDDTTTIQGAPRRMVDDAWRTLNRRYAIGTGVLVTALLLLWGLGMGPGASRSAPPVAKDTPAALARDASGTATPGGVPGGSTAAGASTGAATKGAGASSAPSGSTTNGSGAAGVASSGSGAAGAASSGSGTPGAGNGSVASGNGAAAASTPRPLPGAPVARLYFEPDQAWPSGEVGPRLAPVLARLKAEPDTKALVSGFHDRRGSAEQNAALAVRRAQVVRRVLIREGIAADRIVLARPQQTQGSGPDREARRVEVTVAR